MTISADEAKRNDLTIIDPLGTADLRITAQVGDSCRARDGSWIQEAQLHGFEQLQDDAAW